MTNTTSQFGRRTLFSFFSFNNFNSDFFFIDRVSVVSTSTSEVSTFNVLSDVRILHLKRIGPRSFRGLRTSFYGDLSTTED